MQPGALLPLAVISVLWTTTESTAYDSLGRVISQTDILDRVSSTSYSEDEHITTESTPAGATTITQRNLDGSTARIFGTAQREAQYLYDNIGNRQQAIEGNDVTVYDANALNQYTAISENGASAFVPQFDADGNQTLIKTATGIWSAVYNAENRPVSFTNNESNTVVECAYDSMGRRSFKKVTVNGTVTLHQRYVYRGYLQIASIDLTRSHHPCLWLLTWDPSQPVVTRPLAIQKDGTWYTYGFDLTKNVCEVFGTTGYINTAYTYPPYGEVTATGNTTQPIQWCSEFYDSELELVYYNYRYYNPVEGRWIGRDLEVTHGEGFLYCYVSNNPFYFDILGLTWKSTKKKTIQSLF